MKDPKAYIQALAATNGASVINGKDGKIYIDGTGTSFPARFTGLSVTTAGSAVNEGLIYVKHATAMSASSSTNQASLKNNGTIIVEDGGFGFHAGATSTTNNTFENNGSIAVNGKDSIGVYIYDGATNNTFTNKGSIIAQDDNFAIKIDRYSKKSTYNTVNLEENSHIEGKVQLTNTTTLNIKNLTNQETLELQVVHNKDGNPSALGQLNIENSHITFIQADKSINVLRFDSVNFKGDSYFGVAEGSTIYIKGTIAAQDGDANFVSEDLGQININTDAGKGNVADGTTINTYYGKTVSDKLAGGSITVDDIINDSIQGQLDAEKDGSEVGIASGYIGDEILLKYDDSSEGYTVANITKNQLTQSNIALAKLNAVAWRNELNTLTDRMSTLRTAPEFAGTWVRYKGGEWDGDGINQQFNGVELGVDKTIGQNFLVGLSASYINGDGDLDNGSADTDNYSGAAYLSYFNSGWFVDVMGKIGKIETDFDLNYNGLKDSGNCTMSGYLVGVETGYRFNFNNFFVEPQVQLTYSYLGGKEFSTDNRTIDFETIESMIGRVGFMSGYDFDDIGSAYLRASYYHDFDGDVDMRVGHNDLFVTESDELDSDWGDVGVGANVTFGGATLFFDVSRSYGGDIDMEWKANAGARYSF